MKQFKTTILSITLGVFFLSGCMPQKKLEYLQAESSTSAYTIDNPAEPVIKPNDELLIEVSSFDDISFNYFQTQGNTARYTGANEMSLSSIAYAVDQEGNINFPILGKFQVKGLTVDKAAEKLAKSLELYFNQPNVIMRFAYKNITVLGEVNLPGQYAYTKNQITIFDALGLARDLTINGNRKDVYLVRKTDDRVNKYHIDLTDESLVLTEFYYLKPNDVLYVKPNRSAKWRVVATPISLILSTISSTLLVVNVIQDNY